MDASHAHPPPKIRTVREGPVSSAQVQGLPAADLIRRALEERPQGCSAWTPPGVEEIAELLPQFSIERLLGRGGMGAVYKGEQLSLGRPVAIKFLPAELAVDGEFLARFQREAKILARLHHPGIVTVYDSGQTTTGNLYFVMEYVEGEDLGKQLQQGGIRPAQALEWAAQICAALDYAHRKGVVHRDIKPVNVLIALDGQAKLLDFGLARPVAEDGSDFTRSSVVLGTPDYMAPEQRCGSVDLRSDIFAVGVLLYEMLAGERPHGAFRPPSSYAGVDARLDAVVLRALQPRPEQRYPSAGEFMAAIEALRDAPPSIVARLLVDRDRRVALAVVAVCVVLAGATLWSWVAARRSPASAAPPTATGVVLEPAALPGAGPAPQQEREEHAEVKTSPSAKDF